MIKNLLLVSAAAIAITAIATTPQQAQSLKIDSRAHVSKVQLPKVVKSQKLANGVTLNVEESNGITRKTISSTKLTNKLINPKGNARILSARAAEGTSATLQESFEGIPADADELWLPDGWTRQTANEARPNTEKWHVSPAVQFFPAPSDGDYYALLTFSSDPQDEWLISPTVTIKEYDQFSFDYLNSPVFYFNLGLVDWDQMTWIKQEVIGTIQVLIKEKDATEWTVLKDMAQDYIGHDFSELLMIEPTELVPYNCELSAYVGKEVQVAVRYLATDANSIAIDNIRIAPPSLKPTYELPYSTLYFGLDNTSNMGYMSPAIAIHPANTPLTWTNTTYNDAATYLWKYSDPLTSDWTTSNNPDELTVTYKPDFSSEFTCRNNLFYYPTLTASAPGASDGTFTAPITFLQAGGTADFMLNDGPAHYGLLPFNVNNDGITIAIVDPETITGGQYGDPGTPIFGYDKNVDSFWTYYTFQGDEGEGDGVKLTHILNCIYAPDAPLVIDGLWLDAKGVIGADAVLKAELLPLSDEGTIIENEILASATCKGTEIQVTEGGMQNYLSIPFKFEKPAVISSADHTTYIVRISGFNDPANVTYFAPYQSYVPNPDGLCHGWLQKDITFQGETRSSLSPIVYFDLGLGDAYNAFAINLDAYYPYITDEDLSVELNAGETKTVALGTYHDGADLTIEHDGPATITATAAGRYNESLLTIVDDGTSGEASQFTVKVSAPGIYKEISVSRSAGVSEITANSAAAVTDVYNIAGQRMNIENLPAGVYVVRRADGSSELIRR